MADPVEDSRQAEARNPAAALAVVAWVVAASDMPVGQVGSKVDQAASGVAAQVVGEVAVEDRHIASVVAAIVALARLAAVVAARIADFVEVRHWRDCLNRSEVACEDVQHLDEKVQRA